MDKILTIITGAATGLAIAEGIRRYASYDTTRAPFIKITEIIGKRLPLP